MKINIVRITKYLLLVLVTLLFTGCATSTVVSRSAPSIDTHKLGSANVIWVERKSIPILMKSRDYTSGRDRLELIAQKRIGQVLGLFGRSVATKFGEQLALNNVINGNEVSIQIVPVSTEIYFGHLNATSPKLVLHATIIDTVTERDLWYLTAEVMEDFDEPDQMLLDNYISLLIKELKSSGWIN